MFFALMIILLPACALFRPGSTRGVDGWGSGLSLEADSTEYELVVFDQGFETWLLMQPQNQYSVEYYKNKNKNLCK